MLTNNYEFLAIIGKHIRIGVRAALAKSTCLIQQTLQSQHHLHVLQYNRSGNNPYKMVHVRFGLFQWDEKT